MKILYLANLRLPTEKAHGIQIAKTCEALGKLTDLTLIYPARKNKIKEDIFEYYGIERTFKLLEVSSSDFYWPKKLSFWIKNIISAINLIRKAPEADIYYTRDELAAFLLSFKKNVIFECHRFSPRRKLFYSRIKNLKVAAISNVLKKDLLDYGFKDVTVIPDGIDIKMFDVDISKEEARKKLNLPLNQDTIIYIGSSHKWKGWNILPNVRWITGRPYKEIPLWLKAADVLVLPNMDTLENKYTSPMKMFEYMASGRPIVASDLSVIREVLNESNAVLVEPDKIHEGINKLLDDKELGYRLAKQARLDVEKYSWSDRAKTILRNETS